MFVFRHKFTLSVDASKVAHKHCMSTVIILEGSARGMLIDLDFQTQSIDGNYIARLMKYVMAFYKFEPSNCVEFVCDGHSANRRAFNLYLRKVIPNATYMTCFAHMWNNVHKDFAEFRTALMKASKRLSNLTSTDPMFRHPGASFLEAVQIFSPIAFRNKLSGLSHTDIERWKGHLKCVKEVTSDEWADYIRMIKEHPKHHKPEIVDLGGYWKEMTVEFPNLSKS
ncbi:hypothetical protein RvY_16332-3 [Ramazzottius varieornatus]|uniref:DUF659 domain-containing protein n=1 Tax=Ramazzottius varieornatus TaxID=947166 RepID=A0A1D1W2G7_RAMVA|nr:hypothetical protein RvY_16332-3 [Ramazzottius varieornatus]